MNWTNFYKQIEYPTFLSEPNYLTVMGSRAYGLATEDSDYDFYGFVVPSIGWVFPHTRGEISGFGRNVQKFEQAQSQHVQTEFGETDTTIYNIVKYFQLLMGGNPNLVDSIFTPESAVVKLDSIGSLVRENRELFLSQKCCHTFKEMAFSHINRLENRKREGKRLDVIKEFGYDTKDASNVIRIVLEMYQILFTGTLDMGIPEVVETVKSVRNGELDLNDVRNMFDSMLKLADDRQDEWVVPYSPDERKIKQLLVNCLEQKYGNLERIGFKWLG